MGIQHGFLYSIQTGYSGDIVKNTVSGWVKKTILLAYKETQPEAAQLQCTAMYTE
jgi:hypothetical protein